MAVVCNDRASILADIPNCIWSQPNNVTTSPVNVPDCYQTLQDHVRCQCTNKRNHRTAGGATVTPFYSCPVCQTEGSRMLNHARRRATDAGLVFPIRGRVALRSGTQGYRTRGRLCNHCTAMEIEAYYRRRYVNGRTKSAQDAGSTCKCDKELRKKLCYLDRRDLQDRIQHDTDRFAGQGGWLEHLDHDLRTNRAIWVGANAALLNRRRNAGLCDNACRCGRDIQPPVGPQGIFDVPTPVAVCTACTGVHVDITHNGVVNWQRNPIQPAGYLDGLEQNLTMGRRIRYGP